MNATELQALLSAFGTMADSGKDMFFWWLVYRVLEQVAIFTSVLCIIGAVVHTLKWLNPRPRQVSPLVVAVDAVRHLWYTSKSGPDASKYYDMFRYLEENLKQESEK